MTCGFHIHLRHFRCDHCEDTQSFLIPVLKRVFRLWISATENQERQRRTCPTMSNVITSLDWNLPSSNIIATQIPLQHFWRNNRPGRLVCCTPEFGPAWLGRNIGRFQPFLLLVRVLCQRAQMLPQPEKKQQKKDESVGPKNSSTKIHQEASSISTTR